MKISVITMTCDRPIGIQFLERYMAAQTVQPHEWIVADGGSTACPLTMGQRHIHHPTLPGAGNLANNLLRGLRHASGDVVIIAEDDDILLPNHIEMVVSQIRMYDAVGCPTLKYFNVREKLWIEMQNRGSALCQTAFRRQLIPLMEIVAKECLRSGSYGIDQLFWQRCGAKALMPQTVIGIKGLPGTAGLGVGHRPDTKRRKWNYDPEFLKLREWVGDAIAEPYTRLVFPD